MNIVKASQDKAIRVARDTLGQLHNPFVLPEWLPELRNKNVLRADLIAGLTVALVLIPQSMAYAQLERGILSERVKAGMERARKQGHQIGRPRVIDRRGFKNRFGAILERLREGSISRRQAARELDIGYATLKRLLDAES